MNKYKKTTELTPLQYLLEVVKPVDTDSILHRECMVELEGYRRVLETLKRRYETDRNICMVAVLDLVDYEAICAALGDEPVIKENK